MKGIGILSGLICLTLLGVSGAFGEILGEQPGTSKDPKDNVPKEIQRSALGESEYPAGSSGPGTRSDELVGMKKEKPEAVTQQELEHNVEKTHGGGAAVAAEVLKEKELYESKEGIKHKEAASNQGPKKDPQAFRDLNKRE
jgi:hypothetical protein